VAGLPDKAMAESRERVQGALVALGLAVPPPRVTVNLAPADCIECLSDYRVCERRATIVPMETVMAHGSDNVAFQQALSEALRHAGSNDLGAIRSVLEANADAVEVSQRYADLAQALYNQRKGVAQMVAVAKAGIQYCLDAAARLASKDPSAAETLKNNAKVIAFNAAANSWPGWGDEGVVIKQTDIQEGTDLATRSLKLVEQLKLGHDQLGNAHWLIGALHLAASRSGDAITALTCARESFSAGANRISELMALGYLALARKRQGVPEGPNELEQVCKELQKDGSQDAIAYVQQLRTADRLL
jgi:Mg-chelatase subunit ChlI-like protein